MAHESILCDSLTHKQAEYIEGLLAEIKAQKDLTDAQRGKANQLQAALKARKGEFEAQDDVISVWKGKARKRLWLMLAGLGVALVEFYAMISK